MREDLAQESWERWGQLRKSSGPLGIQGEARKFNPNSCNKGGRLPEKEVQRKPNGAEILLAGGNPKSSRLSK